MKAKTLNIYFKRIIESLSWETGLSFSIDDDRHELVITSNTIFCSSMFIELAEFCYKRDLCFYVSTIIDSGSYDKLVCYVKSNFVVEK